MKSLNFFAGVAAIAASLLLSLGCGSDDVVGTEPATTQTSTATSGPKPDGTPCETNIDCMGGNVCADETSACVAGLCASRAAGDALSHAGFSCSDGSMCTTGDTCSGGKCSGKVVDCDDKTTCTNDSCDPKLGCVHKTQVGVQCTDGNACTSNDACTTGGKCVGDKVDCDDKNPCTTDSCDPAKGCVNSFNANPCDDGNVCTEGDVCKDGACGAGKAKSCDDGKQCVDDACDPIKGCAYKASIAGQMCDDGLSKTNGDACNGNGQCVGKTSTACSVDSDCAKLDVDTKCATYVCNTSLGLCAPKENVLVDDANLCTKELCDPKTGNTLHLPIAASCEDGNKCTVGDQCLGGQCASGTATLPCDDGNACTLESCESATGCATTFKVCDDKNTYTDDSCAPKFGCQFVPQKVQVSCEIPEDFMKGFVFAGCSLEAKFGKVAASGMKSYSSLQIGEGIEIPLENVCATLAGGAVLLVKGTAYMDDGTPIGAGGSVTSVTAPGGTKVPGKLQIWSDDEPDRVITAEDMKKWCK